MIKLVPNVGSVLVRRVVMQETRMFEFYVLLKRAFRSVKTLAECHLAFEFLLDLFSSPAGSFVSALF